MTQQPILVADYGVMRYQYPLSPDKVTYTISGEIEADFYIPDRGHPFQIGLHAVIAEFSGAGDLQVLVAMVGSQGYSINTQENIVTTIDGVAFHVEYQSDASVQIYLETEKTIYFGRYGGNKVTLTRCLEDYAFFLDKDQDGAWALHTFPNSRERIYINGRCCERPHILAEGDIIHFDGYRIRMGDVHLTLYHQNACGIHAQSDRLGQHLVESVLAAVVGKVLEHLNEQEERGGVYLADLHQHFGKAVGVVIGQQLYIVKLIDRRKLLPDNACDKVYVFLVSVNGKPCSTYRRTSSDVMVLFFTASLSRA